MERKIEKQRIDESLKYDKVEIKKDDEIRSSDEIHAEFDTETVIDDRRTVDTTSQSMASASASSSLSSSVTAALPIIYEHRDMQPKVAHALNHDLNHGEPVSRMSRIRLFKAPLQLLDSKKLSSFLQIYAIKTESYPRASRNLYFTLAFTAFTLLSAMIIGIAVIRRRNARLPQNQVCSKLNNRV